LFGKLERRLPSRQELQLELGIRCYVNARFLGQHQHDYRAVVIAPLSLQVRPKYPQLQHQPDPGVQGKSAKVQQNQFSVDLSCSKLWQSDQ